MERGVQNSSAVKRRGETAPVEAFDGSDRAPHVEMGANHLGSSEAHSAAERGIGAHPLDGECEDARILGRDHQAGAPVTDDLRYPADRGGDGGPPQGQRLEQRQRMTFVTRGQDHGVSEPHQREDVGPAAQQVDGFT